MKIIFYILFILLLNSCHKTSEDNKFDKNKWLEKSDINTYPNRNDMLDNLLTNYKLKGLTYKQLTDLIGNPTHDYDSKRNELRYPISTEYGMDIDPIYTKTLLIELTSDSIVSGYKINEWKKK